MPSGMVPWRILSATPVDIGRVQFTARQEARDLRVYATCTPKKLPFACSIPMSGRGEIVSDVGYQGLGGCRLSPRLRR